MTEATTRPVVVTTEHRGVFFGYLPDADTFLHPADANAVTLTDARMCVYWSAETRGVLGLAATGPARGSKVTAAVPKITLTGVTAVMDASDEAVKAWLAQPWS